MKFPVRMVGKHGAMHAYSVSEVAQLQSLGWAVEVVPVIKDDTEREPEDVIDTSNVQAEPQKRKPGRPRKVQ